jgi:integrase
MVDIKIPGVKVYWRRGKPYAYHRKTGARIKVEFGSAAFFAEVEALNVKAALREEVKSKGREGTLGDLIERYRASPEFTQLAPRTRSDYNKVFDYLKPLAGDFLDEFTAGYVTEIRDAAFIAKKRHFANYVVAVLKLTFQWAQGHDLLKVNPAMGAVKLRRPRNAPRANRPWDGDECAAVLDAATGGLKVGIALGMFAGMREGDAVGATRAIYDGAWLRWSQNKTGDLVELPVDPRLKTILDEALSARQGSPLAAVTLAVGERGKPYTLDGFRTMFFRLITRLESEGRVRPGLTFHGLRHTAGRTLAERGADTQMIAVMLGHRTLAMAAHYSDQANRKKLAKGAITKLRPKSS